MAEKKPLPLVLWHDRITIWSQSIFVLEATLWSHAIYRVLSGLYRNHRLRNLTIVIIIIKNHFGFVRQIDVSRAQLLPVFRHYVIRIPCVLYNIKYYAKNSTINNFRTDALKTRHPIYFLPAVVFNIKK
jgi:hypothetical protein